MKAELCSLTRSVSHVMSIEYWQGWNRLCLPVCLSRLANHWANQSYLLCTLTVNKGSNPEDFLDVKKDAVQRSCFSCVKLQLRWGDIKMQHLPYSNSYCILSIRYSFDVQETHLMQNLIPITQHIIFWCISYVDTTLPDRNTCFCQGV